MANGEKDFRLLMGSALLRAYKEDWTPRAKDIDSFVEELSQTIDGITPEELTCAKVKSARYTEISRDIKKMEKILSDMTEDQAAIIDWLHWSGIPVEEMADRFGVTSRTMYRWIDAIDKKVYIGWYSSWEL